MAYSEFYCNASTGDNTNSGSDEGSPVFTNTNANWDGTSIFTPNNGQNPVTQGVVVGMFAAVFLDGAATATRIARVTAVTNATNGTITLSTTFTGGAVAVGTTGRTIRVGGCWKGPNAAVGFPFTLSNLGLATNSSGNMPRINMKNNASYSISTGISFSGTAGGAVVIQGYASSVGDGGRAVITTTTNAVSVITTSSTDRTFIDLEFVTTATTGTATGVTAVGFNYFYRCVFHGWRGICLAQSAGGTCWINECEFYDFNKSNSAGLGAIVMTAGNSVFNSYFHDASSANCNGIVISSGNHQSVIVGHIFDNLGGSGVLSNGGTAAEFISQNDFYHCGCGIKLVGANIYHLVIRNNNFIGNTTYAFDGNNATHIEAYMHNNGYGSGTEANTSGNYNNTQEAILDDSTGNNSRIVYAANTTPYNAPTTGDFRISLAAAKNTGRGFYPQTDGSATGTVAYPDIGAVQHQDSGGGGGTEVSYGFSG
jgi:hypothetical protein